jgi:hypothetical protein
MLANESFSDLATVCANLIMSQVEQMPQRIYMLQDHLQDNTGQAGFGYTGFKKMIPAIQIYMQIVRICSPILLDVKRIDINTDLDSLFKLFQICQDVDGANHLKVLRQYMLLLLCPPMPFVNSNVVPIDFGEAILEKLKKP